MHEWLRKSENTNIGIRTFRLCCIIPGSCEAGASVCVVSAVVVAAAVVFAAAAASQRANASNAKKADLKIDAAMVVKGNSHLLMRAGG